MRAARKSRDTSWRRTCSARLPRLPPTTWRVSWATSAALAPDPARPPKEVTLESCAPPAPWATSWAVPRPARPAGQASRNKRVIALPIEMLRKVETAIVASGGPQQDRDLAGVLRAKLCNVLVCDEATAARRWACLRGTGLEYLGSNIGTSGVKDVVIDEREGRRRRDRTPRSRGRSPVAEQDRRTGGARLLSARRAGTHIARNMDAVEGHRLWAQELAVALLDKTDRTIAPTPAVERRPRSAEGAELESASRSSSTPRLAAPCRASRPQAAVARHARTRRPRAGTSPRAADQEYVRCVSPRESEWIAPIIGERLMERAWQLARRH